MEPPVADEGFTAIDERAFMRHAAHSDGRRAVVLEYDGVLCTGTTADTVALQPEDVTLSDHRRERLRRLQEEGWLLFAHAWRPQVARGEIDRGSVDACFARTRTLLGAEIALSYCVHDAGPPICWCRKPLPGLILEFALAHRVDLSASMYVGRSPADRTMAGRLRMTYVDKRDFFARSDG